MAAVSAVPREQAQDHDQGVGQANAVGHDVSKINGAAVQHNSSITFSSLPPRSETDKMEPFPPLLQQDMPSSPDDLQKPISNVQGGLGPTAPFIPESQPAVATDVNTPADASMLDVATTGSAESLLESTMSTKVNGAAHGAEEMHATQTPTTAGNAHEASAAPNGLGVIHDGHDVTMADEPQSRTRTTRERDDDDEDEPSSKRIRTAPTFPEAPQAPSGENSQAPAESSLQTAAPNGADSLNADASAQIVNSATTISAPPAVPSAAAPPTSAAPAGPPMQEKNWGPTMTDAQNRQCRQTVQNLKKGRHAPFFSKPVDYVTLNIPTYPDVIKNPMDLTTLEQKLREGKYGSVPDFIADFDLIAQNSHKFNGRAHPVSIAADNLKAQFDGGMRKVPEAGQAAPTPPPKKRSGSFALPSRDIKPRAGRQSLPVTAVTAAAPPTKETFALSNSGIPTVRRTSTTDGRPKREIKPAQPRDMPYSTKPKKKKFQMELKFCEHVLTELNKGRYAALMVPFSKPVDPVAFNIPNYHKVIKKPMDFGTITRNLQTGDYENAKEFEADVRLIFENCVKFNGPAHPIAALAKQFEDIFNAEWSHKASWINHNAPSSAPQSPEGDSESDQDDEAVEEEEDEVANQADELRRIQQQIAELSAHAMSLTSGPLPKAAKTASKKASKVKTASTKPSKKSSTPAGGSKRHSAVNVAKPKVKALKPLTNAQKEELSNRIGELDANQMMKAAENIKAALRKHGRADLAERADDELEFDISVIPEEALQAIWKMIKSNEPTSSYRAPVPAAGGPVKNGSAPPRTKKNKPMSKHEQEAAIRRLENQARAFESGVKAEESSPGNDEDEADDDESSGSESEEE